MVERSARRPDAPAPAAFARDTAARGEGEPCRRIETIRKLLPKLWREVDRFERRGRSRQRLRCISIGSSTVEVSGSIYAYHDSLTHQVRNLASVSLPRRTLSSRNPAGQLPSRFSRLKVSSETAIALSLLGSQLKLFSSLAPIALWRTPSECNARDLGSSDQIVRSRFEPGSKHTFHASSNQSHGTWVAGA